MRFRDRWDSRTSKNALRRTDLSKNIRQRFFDDPPSPRQEPETMKRFRYLTLAFLLVTAAADAIVIRSGVPDSKYRVP
ncbi:MAG TPA: hypothetical protein VJ696_12695, partial [Rhodanobacteraceae bacterium]|nr:hypothetical protein [Rhodanobacteraceae bacterium]